MELSRSILEIAKNISELFGFGEWYGYYNGLEGDMQKLKRKIDELSAQEDDINAEIRRAEFQPWKRRKKVVEVWQKHVPQLKDDVQRLEQKVVRERNAWKIISRARLGKCIFQKVQEVAELQETGRSFNDLLVDDFPTYGLSMPPTKDFLASTEAGNVERVWECLMNDDVRLIGVYGMGGVGKTTIMKQIHNWLLEKKKEKFDAVLWVTASKAFNVLKLQSDIAKELYFSLRDDKDETRRASQLLDAFSQGKKYVLIIDDLWDEFRLERVGIPEPTQCNGCKIVLITRSLDVCRSMDCTSVKVELLTQQEALTLFVRKVVRNGMVLAPEVEEIAAEIAKRCAGLPLGIVAVAQSLRKLEGIHGWRDALNDFISLRKEASVGETEVFEILKFSYDRLENKLLQDCFLYCSLYPDDHLIPVNELIEYWIAEELIVDMESVERQFNKGHAIVGTLTSKCLLESVTYKHGMIEYVKLHYSIRDMALRITASSPRYMVNAGETEQRVPYEHWSNDLKRISFMCSSIIELPISLPVCPLLTTLLLNGLYSNQLEMIPNSFFTKMPCLAVLDLSRSSITSLPESISNLEKLHALILDYCSLLKYVPSLGGLKALKIFVLTNSEIEELPEGIEELVNLIKLDLSHNSSIRRTFPSRKLRSLSKLRYLRIDDIGVEVSADDLLCLSQLNGVGVNFYNVQELTRYAISQQFQRLQEYCLIVGQRLSFKRDLGKEFSISFKSVHFGSGVDLPVLPEHIESFGLDGFHDPILFDKISQPHSIYINLKELSFIKCNAVKNIFSLQLLQNFPNLERLSVKSCENVKDIIVEIAETSDRSNHQDYSNSISLLKLKGLTLVDLPRLKSIYNGVMVCPSIGEVVIDRCPMVRRLPLSLHIDGEQATAPPALKSIFGQKEWWDFLEWDDPLAKTILQPYARLSPSGLG